VAFHINLYQLDIADLQLFAEQIERQNRDFFKHRSRLSNIDKTF